MFLSVSDVCLLPILTFISLGLAISFLCLSVSLFLFHMKREVGRQVGAESYYNNWIIQSEKSLATLDCFAPTVATTKEYCSICLETAFISEEFGMKF